ncbi:MAG: type secretion system rane protein PorP/SprF [Flavipsychrobacter sp.]|nr:type secretion system rane protein PorP/SprF [Flavipsychrobacter sp.]
MSANELINKIYTKSKALSINICAGAMLLMGSSAVYAQADIHFSQFYETSVLRNPSLTGVFEDDYKLGAYYRTQWGSISHPYVTALISAETHFAASRTSDDFFSIGLLGYADKAGSIDEKITAFYPALNYNKCLNVEHNTYISVGFTGGYVQYSFDPAKATFNNQYMNGMFNAANPTMESIPNAKMTLWDLGGGVNFNSSRGENNAKVSYIIGASGYHFTQPVISYYHNTKVSENIRWNGNAAISYVFSDNVSVQAQGNYAKQGTYNEIMVGGLLNWTQTKGMENLFVISGGAYMRLNDALIPVVKMKYKTLAIALSYDVNISTLSTASNLQGGTELTIFFTGNYTDKGITRKTVCPKF